MGTGNINSTGIWPVFVGFTDKMPVLFFLWLVIIGFSVSQPVLGALLSSTYLGGRGDDRIESITVDSEGNVYVAGFSYPRLVGGFGLVANFPITEGSWSADQPEMIGGPFIAKFNPDLSELLASTFVPMGAGLLVLDPSDGTVIVGGDGGFGRFSTDLKTLVDSIEFRLLLCDIHDMHLAPDGSVLLTGSTTWDEFPVTAGAFDTTRDATDGFVLRVDREFNQIQAATLVGGPRSDVLYGITTDPLGNIYVAGFSDSGWNGTEPYPTTAGALQEQLPDPGYMAAVVTRFDANLSTVLNSTYLGGSDKDRGFDIVVDDFGRVYVTGTTVSPDFPTTEGAFDREPDPTVNSYDGEIFISRLDENLTTLQASTFFGTPGIQEATAMELDGNGITIAGVSSAYEEPLPVTPGAYMEESPEGFALAFISRLDSDLSDLRASTLVGGAWAPIINGLAFGPSDEVYLAGTSEAWDLPMVPGGFDTSYNGGQYRMDGFIMRFTGDLMRSFTGGIEIAGRVTVNGAPLSDVHVELEGPHGGVTTSDALGEFVFLSRLDGQYTIRVEREYYGFTDPEQSITVSGNDVQVPEFQGSLSSIFGWVDLSGPIREVSRIPNREYYAGLSDVHFVDHNEGWVTNSEEGKIYHTIDGGNSWEVQTVLEPCYTVHMLDAMNGYAGGSGSIIFRTSDGGETWNIHGFTGSFLDMDFPPEGDNGCVSGDDGNFWWITPEGVTRVQTGSSSTLRGVSYPRGGNKAWAVGGNRIKLVNDEETTDLIGPGGTFNDISLYANGEEVVGWVVGDVGVIGYTPDGIFWVDQVNQDLRNRSLSGVHALNASKAWAVGNGSVIHHTQDGGLTWEVEGRSMPERFLRSVFAVDSETVYAVGNEGTFFKYTRLEPPTAYTGPLTITDLSWNADSETCTLTWEPATGKATLDSSSDLETWQPLAEDITGTSWTGLIPDDGERVYLRLSWEVVEP